MRAQITADANGLVVLGESFPDIKAGYSATLNPSSGVGPYDYAGYWGDLDLDATETSASVAMAVFLNVDRNGGPYVQFACP